VYPLHSVGGSRGEGGSGIAGRGENDHGGGERPWIADPCRRIVGVHLSQPRYLRLGVPHQRQERKYLAADPRDGVQPVVVAGQVGSLVRQDRVQLGGIEHLHRASGQDHGRIPAGDTVGGRLGMFHQHGPEGGLGMADQPRGLRVLQRLAPGGAQVSQRGERGAGRDSARQGEAEPGHGGTARRSVGGTEPQHAGSDEVAQPPADGGGMYRQRQAGQAEGGNDRPSGGQVGDNGQQRRPGRPAGPAQQPGA
jgi:hypothetical protein